MQGSSGCAPFGLSDRKAGITRALDPPYPQAYEYEELMIASEISGALSQHKWMFRYIDENMHGFTDPLKLLAQCLSHCRTCTWR